MAVTPDNGLSDNGPRNLACLDTIEGRIAAWCAWFGFEEPKLKRNRKRAVLLNDDLLTWLYASSSSFEWIVAGDVQGMAAAFRKEELPLRRFNEVLNRFNDVETALLLDALKANKDRGVPLEEALAGWTKAVETHRAQVQPNA